MIYALIVYGLLGVCVWFVLVFCSGEVPYRWWMDLNVWEFLAVCIVFWPLMLWMMA